jgi:hypothetical protein
MAYPIAAALPQSQLPCYRSAAVAAPHSQAASGVRIHDTKVLNVEMTPTFKEYIG